MGTDWPSAGWKRDFPSSSSSSVPCYRGEYIKPGTSDKTRGERNSGPSDRKRDNSLGIDYLGNQGLVVTYHPRPSLAPTVCMKLFRIGCPCRLLCSPDKPVPRDPTCPGHAHTRLTAGPRGLPVPVPGRPRVRKSRAAMRVCIACTSLLDWPTVVAHPPRGRFIAYRRTTIDFDQCSKLLVDSPEGTQFCLRGCPKPSPPQGRAAWIHLVRYILYGAVQSR